MGCSQSSVVVDQPTSQTVEKHDNTDHASAPPKVATTTPVQTSPSNASVNAIPPSNSTLPSTGTAPEPQQSLTNSQQPFTSPVEPAVTTPAMTALSVVNVSSELASSSVPEPEESENRSSLLAELMGVDHRVPASELSYLPARQMISVEKLRADDCSICGKQAESTSECRWYCIQCEAAAAAKIKEASGENSAKKTAIVQKKIHRQMCHACSLLPHSCDGRMLAIVPSAHLPLSLVINSPVSDLLASMHNHMRDAVHLLDTGEPLAAQYSLNFCLRAACSSVRLPPSKKKLSGLYSKPRIRTADS